MEETRERRSVPADLDDCAVLVKRFQMLQQSNFLRKVSTRYLKSAYSLFACFRSGTSESASFHSLRKS